MKTTETRMYGSRSISSRSLFLLALTISVLAVDAGSSGEGTEAPEQGAAHVAIPHDEDHPSPPPPSTGTAPESAHPAHTDSSPPHSDSMQPVGGLEVEHPAPKVPGTHPAPRKQRATHAKPDSGVLSGPLPERRFTWSADQGPLLLASDVVVGPGQILEVGAGTEIRIAARDVAPAGTGDWLDSQQVSLVVDGGTLRLLGTPGAPIRFTPLRRGPAPHWGGIRIVGTREKAQIDVRWIDIPRAHVAVDLDRSVGRLRHVVVRDASMGIRCTGGSAPEIAHSIVTGSRIAGLHSERSGPIVSATIFVDNKGAGARFDGTGLARLENNAFWNNGGGDIVKGPPRTGGWSTDSIVTPDAYGNVRTNPVFRASSLHAKLLARKRDSLRLAPLWKRRLPENPRGDGPWALSPFSPLLDRGSASPLCRDADGSACDIGLWGSKD